VLIEVDAKAGAAKSALKHLWSRQTLRLTAQSACRMSSSPRPGTERSPE
jgi:hypothetical protein